MEVMPIIVLYGPAIFAIVAPLYLGARVFLRWRDGVRGDFPMMVWLLSSAAQVLITAAAMVSIVLPVEVPIQLFAGVCLVGVALSLSINWLRPEGWTKRDFRVSNIANMAILWTMVVVVVIAGSLGSGH